MKTPKSLILKIFLAFSGALTPLWRLALARRLKSGKETAASVDQKLMRTPAPWPAGREAPAGGIVWGHAVGVGEAQALAGLFAALGRRLPEHGFVITTTARTSGQALAAGLPPRCVHQFAPIDTPAAARRFVSHWQPVLALWCEMDLWPCAITAAAERGVPLALVNARLSDKSLRQRLWARWLYQPLLRCFDALFAQNQATADGLARLGAPASRIQVTGTIKSLAQPLPHDGAELARLRQAIGMRPVWLAASTHAGEETLALQAHAELRQTAPDALLIIAPRYPARGAEVAALGTPALPRRSLAEAPDAHTAIYVADTIGEMGLWYRLAPVALVGGSFASVGGHNPYEPLGLGCTVLHGPVVHNFAESYAELDAQGQATLVGSAADIAAAVHTAWQRKPTTNSRAMASQAATETLLRALEQLARQVRRQ